MTAKRNTSRTSTRKSKAAAATEPASTKPASTKPAAAKAVSARSAAQALATLSSVLEQLPACVLVADTKLAIAFANRRSQEALASLESQLRGTWGFGAQQVIGKPLDAIFADRPRLEQVLAGTHAATEADFVAGNTLLHASLCPLMDAQGRAQHLLVLWEDVTYKRRKEMDISGQIAAIGRTQAVIEFELDGTVITANENFLSTMGYTLNEIQGRHHSMFVGETARNAPSYKEMWAQLNRGEPLAGEFCRISKAGQPVWLQAVYTPIRDMHGMPFKVVKYASDITEAKRKSADHLGQINAIGRVQATIEFTLDGRILTANSNFLQAVGYRLDEVVGRHHSMFVDPAFASTSEYRMFWQDLSEGHEQTGRFRRIGKEGKEVWIQGSYFPILDANGKPWKVVKYVTDVTRLKIIETDLESTVHALAGAAQELTSVSQLMASNSEETAVQASVVSAAAEQVSQNVSTVSTATEEMGASIREIAKNANEAARVATSAVKVADRTNMTISKLGDSSAEIGNVVKVITSIAQQTNLLALNATIEAARAGEAGKGFAVVANEVKELAKQTAKATEDISRKIEAIQADTKGAVEAIGHIGMIIGQINDIQSTIASAVEQQTATTSEIARNVTEAAKGSGEIAKNVMGVAQAARSTTEGAANTKTSADELAKMAGQLQDLVTRLQA